MSDKIEIGDQVTFQFSTHPPIYGKVAYMPQATGDCWRITTEAGKWSEGKVYYVQTFDFVEKVIAQPSDSP